MKQAFRLSCAAALFVLLVGALVSLQAQTTPDPFVAQITTSTSNSYAGDMSGNGRFVVIESTGDIATDKSVHNNADGNREIFLFDYAQRRIFQITDTKSARVDTTKPAIDSTKPTDFSNVKVEVSNNRPTISNNSRWIAFSSNASTPGSFDGDANSAALVADGNQEIFIYFIPATTTVDLSKGADTPFVDLSVGEFTRITNTPASRKPVPGTATSAPFVAFDNRDAAQSDNAAIVSFVSTRDLTGNNADSNPEIFVFRRTAASPLTGTLSQLTNTQGQLIFNENPSLSGSGAAITFISNANISAGGSTNNADGNAEVYLGSVDTTTGVGTVTRQITRTAPPFAGVGVNFLSPGRRLSRDGNLVALESLADLSGNSSIQSNTTVFIYNVSANSFTQVGPRATNSSAFRFPTFTDYNASLSPSTIVFTTGLNFNSDGTAPSTATGGLNPNGATQIFSAPVSAPTTFTRLTNTPGGPGGSIEPFPSNARGRMAFSLTGTELGGSNTDNSSEAFYLLSREGTDASGATLSFFTGASNRTVVSTGATPPAVSGLAPGMLGIVRSTTALAPSNQNAGGASESTRRPPLPIELNGVSVSINSAAAGLYSVNTGQINFVVPPGLVANTGTSTYPVVINNNGTVIRSTIQLLAAQPDIFTSTTDAGGRAVVFLSGTMTGEPFTVTSADNTVVSIFLTGVRNVQKAQVTVRIGTTDITGDRITFVGATDTPGFDQIDVKLPPSLAGSGDVPIVISITISSTTFTSRPADTAPRVRIN